MAINQTEERISGLLAILVVVFLVLIPVFEFIAAYSHLDSLGALSTKHPSFEAYQLYVWVAAVISGLLSLSVGLVLARGRSSISVYYALMGMWILGPVQELATSLINGHVFDELLVTSAASNGSSIFLKLLLSLIGPTFWSLYLLSSEKVAKVYGFPRLWSDRGLSTTMRASDVLEARLTLVESETAVSVSESDWVAVKSYMSKTEESVLERDRAILFANHIEHEVRQAHMVTVFVKGCDLSQADALIVGTAETNTTG